MLGLVTLLLTLAHLVVMTLYYLYWSVGEFRWTADQFRFFSTLFNLNEEANPATWYSSFALLLGAALLGVIAVDKVGRGDRYARHWAVLALIFLYLSIDEGGRLHERAILPLRSALSLTGFFFYGWVLLGIPAVLLVGIAYLRFLVQLPRGTRYLFLLAAAIFVGGALGVEMIEGYYDELHGGRGESDLVFALLVMLEEGAEMVGVLLFIRALLSYVQAHVGEVRLRFEDGGST